MKKKLTQERLKEVLDYNSETGIFVWKERINCAGYRVSCSGKKAGCLGIDSGYRFIGIDRELYREHRLAWLYIYGYFPEHQVDHIDQIRHHNWITNLREATNACNGQNCKILKNNKSGITGVAWKKDRKKWRARIEFNKKQIHLGYFINKIDAAKARYSAKQKYFDCIVVSSAEKYIKENNNDL